MVIPSTETATGLICALVDRAVKVGIPVVEETRRQNCGSDPAVVYFTPPTSVVCVVAP